MTVEAGASPFERHEPDEPARGTVLAYQRVGHSGAVLDYVSVRAGDGRWYTTGGAAKQGVDWAELWSAVRQWAAGPVRYPTAWAELDAPRPALGAGSSVVAHHDTDAMVAAHQRAVRDWPQA